LLIVYHSPTLAMSALSDQVIAGAKDDAIEGIDVLALPPDQVTAETINAANGIVILTPANFGYMAGMVKDLFDRTFLDIGGALSVDGSAAQSSGGRKPYALCVHGRYDAEGAVSSIERIVAALPWRRVAPVLTVIGAVDESAKESAYEFGAAVAALLT
jgi:multimeric flavodoxin WrbA